MLNTRNNCAFQPHYLQKHTCNSKSFKISFSTYHGVCLLYVTIKAWMMHNIQQCPDSWVVPSNLLSNVLTTLTVSLVLFNLFCLRVCVLIVEKSHHFCFLLAEITWSDLFFLVTQLKSTVTIHVTSRPWPSLTMYHPSLFRLGGKLYISVCVSHTSAVAFGIYSCLSPWMFANERDAVSRVSSFVCYISRRIEKHLCWLSCLCLCLCSSCGFCSLASVDYFIDACVDYSRLCCFQRFILASFKV